MLRFLQFNSAILLTKPQCPKPWLSAGTAKNPNPDWSMHTSGPRITCNLACNLAAAAAAACTLSYSCCSFAYKQHKRDRAATADPSS